MNPSDLLSLPTDSLYKFMATTGVVILLVSIIFPLYVRRRLTFRLYDIEKDISILELKVDYATEETNRIKERISTIKNSGQSSNADIDSIEADNDQMQKNHRDIDIFLENTKCEMNKAQYLVQSIKNMAIISWAGVIVGGSLSVSGFYLWYVRLQAYVDNSIQTGINP